MSNSSSVGIGRSQCDPFPTEAQRVGTQPEPGDRLVPVPQFLLVIIGIATLIEQAGIAGPTDTDEPAYEAVDLVVKPAVAQFSHAQRLYTVAFIIEKYRIDPEAVVESDDRIRYPKTWDELTQALCEHAVRRVILDLYTGAYQPALESGQTKVDKRQYTHAETTDSFLEEELVIKEDVTNMVAVLAVKAHEALPGSSEQTGSKDEVLLAINDAIDDYRDELLDLSPVWQGSFLDHLEAEYGMTGSNQIETEDTATTWMDGWAEHVQSGIFYHAVQGAVWRHMQMYPEKFPKIESASSKS